MIIVRDIFRLKFGQAGEATTLWKEAVKQLQSSGYGAKGVRLLTDLAGGPYYTIIMETSFDSLSQWEQAHLKAKDNAKWRDLYQKLIPLTEGGHREILRVIE